MSYLINSSLIEVLLLPNSSSPTLSNEFRSLTASTSTSQSNSTVDRSDDTIPDVTKFLDVSAFFLAFFGIYLIIIQVLTILFVCYVIVIPVILCIIWGAYEASAEYVSYEFGAAIAYLGIFIIFIFIGFSNWFGQKWNLTRPTQVLLLLASVLGYAYCFHILFFSDYFTYNGCTAVFFSLNYIFASFLLCSKNKRKRIDVKILVKHLIVNNQTHQDEEKDEDNEQLISVINNAQNETQSDYKKLRIGALACYFIVFIVYIIMIADKSIEDVKLVGLVNASLVFCSDLVLYFIEENDYNQKLMIYGDFFRSIYLLISRLLCCFLVYYWLSMHSIIIFFISLLTAVDLTHKLLVKFNRVTNQIHDAQSLYTLCPLLKFYMKGQFQELKLDNTQIINSNRTIIKLWLPQLAYIVYLLVFIVLTIVSDFTVYGIHLNTYDLSYSFKQWIFAIFALLFAMVLALFYSWYQNFKILDYELNKFLIIYLIIIEVVSAILGVIFYFVAEVKLNIIWTTFLIMPIALGSFLIFYGMWKKNDYRLLEADSNALQQEQQPDQQVVEENPDPNESQNPSVNKPSKMKKMIDNYEKESFLQEAKKIFSCKYRPQTKRDKFLILSLAVNLASIILYSILTACLLSPWIVGYTIGSWVLILQMTLTVFVKYYQTYFKMTAKTIMSTIGIFIVFIVWCIVVGAISLKEYKNSTTVLVVFYMAAFGYSILFIFSLAMMQYMNKGRAKSHYSEKILFCFAFGLLIGVGISMIVLTEYQIWGDGFLIVGLYLIAITFLSKHTGKVSIVFFILLFGYLIFIIAFYYDSTDEIIQGLSLILLLIFLFFAFSFVQKFYANYNKIGKQIFLYSSQLFPALKFLPAKNEMKRSNSELVYFFVSCFVFFIWSVLASILLHVSYRYIGLSFIAITIAVAYIYINHRITESKYLQDEDLKWANLNFYKSSLNFALNQKSLWRIKASNFKTVLDDGNKGKNINEHEFKLPESESISQQLRIHQEWGEYEAFQNKEMGGLFRVFTLGSKINPDQNEYRDPRLLQFIDEGKKNNLDEDGARVDHLIQLYDEYSTENLYDLKFWAFLNGYVNHESSQYYGQMSMKIKNLLNDQTSKLQQMLQEYKQKCEEQAFNVPSDFNLSTIHEYLKTPENKQLYSPSYVYRDHFEAFFGSFISSTGLEFKRKQTNVKNDIIQDQIRRGEENNLDNNFDMEEEDPHNMEGDNEEDIEQEVPDEQDQNSHIPTIPHDIPESAPKNLESLDHAQINNILDGIINQEMNRIQKDIESQTQEFKETLQNRISIKLQQAEDEEEQEQIREVYEAQLYEFMEQQQKNRRNREQAVQRQRQIMLEDMLRKQQEDQERSRIREENQRQQRIKQQQRDEFIEKQKQAELDRLRAADRYEQEQQEKNRQEQERVRREQERLRQQEEHRKRQELWELQQAQILQQQEQMRRRQQEWEDQQRREKEEQKNRDDEYAIGVDGPEAMNADDEQNETVKLDQIVIDRDNSKINEEISFIRLREKHEDEAMLKEEGDKLYQRFGSAGAFADVNFDQKQALGADAKKFGWTRVKDLTSQNASRLALSSVKTVVFDDGLSACDILQGELGDCYLLSAMSVIAHTRPQLLQKIFHERSKEYQENGLYVLMFYRNRRPVIIHVDDCFPSKYKQHAYVRVNNKGGQREIWPLLIEKAYAKMYGSYSNIEGGLVDAALADLTNGAPYRFDLNDAKIKKQLHTGQFWDQLVFWNQKGYLMGAGSPQGKDTDISPMGIVQGHAYSILDIFEVEGTKLLQLRNPWGDTTEWKGAWGDNSPEWTDRRKRIIYDRMKSKGWEVNKIGDQDGIFWMALSDFFNNYEQLFLCRFFEKEWREISYRNEWSVALGTAGGCTNSPTCVSNPQLQLLVESNPGQSGTVEVFFYLQTEGKLGQKSSDDIGIGFEIYDLKGQKVDKKKRIGNAIHENNGGYQVAREVSLDTDVKAQATPYTLFMSTYDAGQEAKFTLTIWYKFGQGTVSIAEFGQPIGNAQPQNNNNRRFFGLF